MTRGYLTDPYIDEYLGLGDWASDCLAQISAYPARYVFRGSRISYTGRIFGHSFYPFLTSVDRNELRDAVERAGGGVFVDVVVSESDGNYAISFTPIEEFADITDVHGIVRGAISSAGYDVANDGIGFTSRPSPSLICGPSGGLQPGAAPPEAIRNQANPSFLERLAGNLGVTPTQLGAGATVAGVVLLVLITKR